MTTSLRDPQPGTATGRRFHIGTHGPGEATGAELDTVAASPRDTGEHGIWRRDLSGPLVLLMTCGLLFEAWAVGRSRAGDLGPATQWLFWISLLVVFVPAAARIVARSTGSRERVVVALALPVVLQLSRTVLYPMFAFHDEFIHANLVRLIEDSGHLFGANSLLPVTSYYPGMEVVTVGVHELTGLSNHASAVVVLVMVRVVLTLALIGLVGGVTGSTRAACVAGLVYTCNPQAIFFNSQYSYQTFALPLAILVLYLFVSRYRAAPLARSMVLPALVVFVVAVSHHLTSMLLVAAFGVWLLIDVTVIRYKRSNDWPGLTVLFVGGALIVGAWAALPGNPVLGYLDTIGASSVGDISARLHGQNTHTLFQSSGGLVSPPWERIATIASIAIVFFAILPALFMLRRWVRGREAFVVLLGIVALAYPIIPLGHVTPGTGEVTDRASGFLYLGVGLAVGLGPVLRNHLRGRILVPGVTALLTVVFVGGVVLGAGPTIGQLPGPFLVSADARSIDAANLAAARWERAHLPANSRVYADRDAGLLAASVGGQYTVTHVADDIDASRILLAPTFTAADRRLIREADIQYVIVDQRDSRALPNQQVYIESGEYGSEDRTTPVTARALHKLAGVPGVRRVYSNGPLVIYDVRVFDAH